MNSGNNNINVNGNGNKITINGKSIKGGDWVMEDILEFIGMLLLAILCIVILFGIYFGAIWLVLKLIFVLFGFGQYLTWQIVLWTTLIYLALKILF